MLSGPGALYGFNCFSNFVIPLQVTKIVNLGSTGTSRKTSKDYTDYSKRRRILVTIKLKNSITI
jgi:hypothetical protein